MEICGARKRLIVLAFLLAAYQLPTWSDARFGEASEPAPNTDTGVGKQAIQPAILANYYEHMREHAPPRHPGGAMQGREYLYRAPTEPFGLLNSKLGTSPADRILAADLVRLHLNWQQGVSSDSDAIESMRKRSVDSSLTSDVLLEAGRGMQWLANEQTAAAFFSAGLAKARSETEAGHVDAVRADRLLHALDQTACLWRCNQPDALVDRFKVARLLNPPLSVESRRAGYLLAEALLADERPDEAATLILRVRDEHAQAGDLGRFERSDISEMDFVTGFILCNAGRPREAIRYLLAVDGEHQEEASHVLFQAYLQTSDFAQARKMLKSTAVPKRSPLQPTPVAAELNDAMNRARWRAEIGNISDPPH